MPHDETSTLLVVLIAVLAIVGVALATVSVTTGHSFNSMMGGRNGMMGQTNATGQASGPGALEWLVLVLSLAFLAVAAVLYLRGGARSPAPRSSTPPMPAPVVMPATSSIVPVGEIGSNPSPAVAGAVLRVGEPVPEPALMKLLDQDERTMYLEIRDHGGAMLQRDLVALGIFSKAKVTRVLDRLEAKDLVVREAHGMTNRVRLVHRSK